MMASRSSVAPHAADGAPRPGDVRQGQQGDGVGARRGGGPHPGAGDRGAGRGQLEAHEIEDALRVARRLADGLLHCALRTVSIWPSVSRMRPAPS